MLNVDIKNPLIARVQGVARRIRVVLFLLTLLIYIPVGHAGVGIKRGV